MSAIHIRPAIARMLVAMGLALVALSLWSNPARADEQTFGVSSYKVSNSSSQAAAHADFDSEFTFNVNAKEEPVDQLKDVHVVLPPGLTGNPGAIPRCTIEEFELFACKPPDQIGVVLVHFDIAGEPPEPQPLPLYNVTPTPGHLATFAASLLYVKILMQVDVRSGASNSLVMTINDFSTLLPVGTLGIHLWGVPASSSHDLERSRTEIGGPQGIYEENEFGEPELIGIEPTPAGVAPTAFLTNSSNCAASLQASTLELDSWQEPARTVTATAPMPISTGCDLLRISPSVSVAPETTRQDTPTGYDIDLHYPLQEEPFGTATPTMQKASFTLPPGTSLSPGVGNGLVGCSDAQFEADECPNASKVGVVAISTPVLPEPLVGSVYIGSPNESAMYRVLMGAAGKDTSFHLSGVAHPDPLTGQVTIAFEGIPQFPFEQLDLHLFGGSGAVFANPATCGPATTTSEVTSYSGQTATASSTFNVDVNGSGGACPAGQPFEPSLSAGTVTPLAGAFSPFTLTVTRGSGQQFLSTIQAQLPAGLLARLSAVPLCPEALASGAQCPQSSQIGTTTIGSGPGTHPLWLGGDVYLTGPYKGAPFGLAITVHAVAGPFDLGTIAIRARILLDPHDLRLTILSDPLPQIRDGIPLRIQALNLSISRPGFIFNPTDCAAQTMSGTFSSAQGASASASTPFQVVGCAGLPFNPKLAARTQAKASSVDNGASLELNLTARPGQANLSSIAVQLPRQLQSRLTTLQTACPARTFEADPRKCPTGSVVGSAKISTPALTSQLTGPVYFVSHGRNGPPTMTMALQGQGIVVDLNGTISISKKNITTSAFRALPDVPISSFSLSFPEGPHSILGANGKLCSKKLVMPTTIKGQNGAQTKQNTTVAVSGCPHKHAKKAKVK
jgi:hypothetical protein